MPQSADIVVSRDGYGVHLGSIPRRRWQSVHNLYRSYSRLSLSILLPKEIKQDEIATLGLCLHLAVVMGMGGM